MNETQLEALLQKLDRESEQKFASWNPEMFRKIAPQLQNYLRWGFRKDEGAADALSLPLLQLLAEGIGQGYLRPTPHGLHGLVSQSLMGWALYHLPQHLSLLKKKDRLPFLAWIWNVCEGLQHEPEWLQRYTLSRLKEQNDLADLEARLEAVFTDAFAPLPPARWQGSLSLSSLDTREVFDHFLPGELYLAAPRVVCVADRRDPSAHTAIFLARGEESRLLGPTGRLPGTSEVTSAPPLHLAPHRVQIGEQSIELPSLSRPHTSLVSAGGFVLISAVDSQRVWVLESL